MNERVDATRMTRVLKELMKLLRNMSEEDYETVGYELKEIKEELGSWYIADYPLYQGS